MGKDGLIFSNRFEQPDFNEILKAVEQNHPKEKRYGAGSGDDFFSFMREHRKLIPNEKRLADKDRFINAVRKLSEEYEIDADMKEIDAGYVAALYMHCALYSGYMKKLLNVIFVLADDFSVTISRENKNYDYVLIFTYYTHNVYLKNREITDFS